MKSFEEREEWQCPVLANWEDPIAVLGHNALSCRPCMLRRLDQRVQGRELLFPDGPPPWLAAKATTRECFLLT